MTGVIGVRGLPAGVTPLLADLTDPLELAPGTARIVHLPTGEVGVFRGLDEAGLPVVRFDTDTAGSVQGYRGDVLAAASPTDEVAWALRYTGHLLILADLADYHRDQRRTPAEHERLGRSRLACECGTPIWAVPAQTGEPPVSCWYCGQFDLPASGLYAPAAVTWQPTARSWR